MPPLSVMLKPSSGNCNMRCDYCFYCDEMEKRSQQSFGFMTEETLRNVIRKTMLQAEHHISYVFQGGEPTLRGLDFFRKAIAYQNQYNHHHLHIQNALQTNGFALDEQWCEFFKENNFLIGVSVDGTQEIHDHFRHSASDKSPTYEKICANIKQLERYGVDYNILTVVTEPIAQNAKAVYEAYRDKGWNYQQYIECLDPFGEQMGQTPYSLTPQSYGIFLVELFDLWYQDLQKGKQPYNRKFENYILILLNMQPESCEQRGQCGVQVVVEADGSVYPCDFYMLDDYKLGNFNADRLPQINAQRHAIGFIERSYNVAKQCKACPYFYICRSGCQRSRDYLPDEQAYINHFCASYRYFFKHCLDRLNAIAQKIRKERLK